MKSDLTQWLCCLECRGDLEIEPISSEGDVLLEGTLRCRACGTGFPVRRGVPRFVAGDGYVGSFSWEWNKWDTVQLDAARGFRESEQTFVEKTGFLPSDLEGKLVLDAGCGAGRFLDVTSRWEARVVGIDFSYAVEAAQANVGGRSNVDVIQADLFNLPFRDGVFDAVFSIGVLHHTKDTRAAFLGLPRLLKQGGEIAVWLYCYPDRLYCRASDFWRAVFRHVPHRLTYVWCWLLVVLLSGLYRKPLLSREPWSHLRRVLPVNTHPDFQWRVLDTFDWYTPRYQDKDNSVPRVVRWFREAGLRAIEVLDAPTAVRGRLTSDASVPLLRSPIADVRGRRIAIFGAGSGGRLAFDELEKLGLSRQVVAVCDNDPAKTGTLLRGHRVRRFEELARADYDLVIVASLPGRAAISAQLEKAGLEPMRDFATMAYISDCVIPLAEACGI